MDIDVIHLLAQLAPEAMIALKRRYEILSAIQSSQPVGRRTLAERLGASERKLRNELEFLQGNGFLHVATAGVSLTEEALGLLGDLQLFISEALGLTFLENSLAEKLGLARAVIVPGDSDTDPAVILGMGRAADAAIKEKMRPHSILAVMGGWTMARAVTMITGNSPGVTVVPARGGLGEEVEIQANTVASRLAAQMGGSYKMLHIPENLDPKTLEALRDDPRIKSVVSVIRNVDILIYSIGRADIMACRRGLSKNSIARLLTKGAVAETLGNYYNKTGSLVDRSPSVGIEISDQKNLSLSLAVAGGKSKAQAIAAALVKSQGQVLITDEGAAKEMLLLLADR